MSCSAAITPPAPDAAVIAGDHGAEAGRVEAGGQRPRSPRSSGAASSPSYGWAGATTIASVARCSGIPPSEEVALLERVEHPGGRLVGLPGLAPVGGDDRAGEHGRGLVVREAPSGELQSAGASRAGEPVQHTRLVGGDELVGEADPAGKDGPGCGDDLLHRLPEAAARPAPRRGRPLPGEPVAHQLGRVRVDHRVAAALAGPGAGDLRQILLIVLPQRLGQLLGRLVERGLSTVLPSTMPTVSARKIATIETR